MITRPEHDFSGGRESWEDRVVANASYFTVITFPGRNRCEYPTLLEATQAAAAGQRTLVYAVAKSGRSVLVPRDKWPTAGDVA